MTDKEETAYMMGHRAALRSILGEVLKGLGYDSDESKANRWILEREDAIAALRTICEQWGDSDWPDNLHLADVINKHLGDYLNEPEAD